MNKKWFIYPLITVAIATVNLLPAMGKMGSKGIIQVATQERVAQLFDISSEQLQRFFSGFQDENSFTVQKIIQKIVQKTNNKSWTLLMHIAKGKIPCKECTRKLELTCQHEEYKKLLHEVYEKVARLLIKGGADINSKNSNNKSALLIAFNSKNKLIIELLLSELNLDLDIQDEHGLTPLHHAIGLGDDYDTIAYQLIQKGASLDITTKKWKETPLMFAARRNCLSLVNTLLAAGANPLLQSDVGQTAAELTTDSAVKHAIVKAKIKKRGENDCGEMSAEALQAAIKSVKKQEEENNACIEQELQAAKNAERCQKAEQKRLAIEKTQREKKQAEKQKREEEQARLEQERERQAEERLAKVQREKEVVAQQKREEEGRCQREEEQARLEQEREWQAEERLAKVQREKEVVAQQKREEEGRCQREEQARLEQTRLEQERQLAKEQKKKETMKNKITVMQSLTRKISSYITSCIKGIKETFLSSFSRLRNWLR